MPLNPVSESMENGTYRKVKLVHSECPLDEPKVHINAPLAAARHNHTAPRKETIGFLARCCIAKLLLSGKTIVTYKN